MPRYLIWIYFFIKVDRAILIALYEIKILIPIILMYHTFCSSNNEDSNKKNFDPNVSVSVIMHPHNAGFW